MVRTESRQIFVDADPTRSGQREAEYLFDRMADLRVKGQLVKLGGATGRTQIEIYRLLLDMAEERDFDLSDVEIYFLDEYFGAAPLYYAYAHQHLCVHGPRGREPAEAGSKGFRSENVWVPRGCFFDEEGRIVNSDRLDAILEETTGQWEHRREPGEPDQPPPEIHVLKTATHPVLKEIRASNERFHQRVCKEGRGRIALLGLGREGHIGFVERGAATGESSVMLIRLARSTQIANESDFHLLNEADDLKVELEPTRYAITQGIASISSAGELLLAAYGSKKRAAVRGMLLGEPGPLNPAAFVQNHPCVRIFLDEEALGDLSADELAKRGFEFPKVKKK